MDRVKLNKSTAKRILWGTTHKNLTEAILADVVDVIPVVGDLGNAIKVYNLAKKGESDKLTLHTGDLVIGIVPVIGAVGDLITPTNTLIFVMRKKKLKSKLRKKLPSLRGLKNAVKKKIKKKS